MVGCNRRANGKYCIRASSLRCMARRGLARAWKNSPVEGLIDRGIAGARVQRRTLQSGMTETRPRETWITANKKIPGPGGLGRRQQERLAKISTSPGLAFMARALCRASSGPRGAAAPAGRACSALRPAPKRPWRHRCSPSARGLQSPPLSAPYRSPSGRRAQA